MYAAVNLPELTQSEQLNRARSDVRMGLPCVFDHNGCKTVMVAIEAVGAERFKALRELFGTPELVLTAQRMQSITTETVAASVTTCPVRIRPPEHFALDWYQRFANPGFDHLNKPAGPLHMLREGDFAPHRLAIEIVKSAEMLPAAAVFTVAEEKIPAAMELPFGMLDVAPARRALAEASALFPVSAAFLPLEIHENGQLHVFRDPDGRTEHYAIEIGSPNRSQPVLSRLHSACFTGDVLGSLKCDCGPQLRAALARMGEEGSGVLLYLNQEGRGIGLANKMRVYDLQSKGLDTVEANHRLGYEDDERDFRIAAVMLKSLGIDAVRLLTNNPAKVETFRSSGITIAERLPLRVGRNEHNHHYLAVKALKSGHKL
ncbi:GTP cyclohydrolase II [uncultured Ruegeria sp.]|uniref:GTP cyclohydrolase II n=1 Tax=uncultured Ruegeria sp. TaxID=259304 RepID=UPI00262CF1D9|nr:GTP cyclohydrolase II [uncultured Ruegeria sp.]